MPPVRLAANDHLVWDQKLFGQRVAELGVAGATSLLRSLLKYLDHIVVVVEDELMDQTSFEIIRSDLAPISVFLGFSGLSTLLLNLDGPASANRQNLAVSIRSVMGACRTYCGQFS